MFTEENNYKEEVKSAFEEERARLKMIEMAKFGKDGSFNNPSNDYGSPGKRVGDLQRAQVHLQGGGFKLNPAFGSSAKDLAEECGSAEAENMVIDEIPIFASDLKKP
jgi:hypothetical protein